MNGNRKLIIGMFIVALLTAASVFAAGRVESLLSVASVEDCTELRAAIEYSGLDQAFQPGGATLETCTASHDAELSGYTLRLLIDASAFGGQKLSSPWPIPTGKCYRAVEALKSARGSLLTIEDRSYRVEAACDGNDRQSHLVLTVNGTSK